ncbi:NACHT domain-containing protein [Streptomyces sp. NPDC046900]|uniref:NACHT domain-containing protein n=1 Tax=Streptomyces sp. NPDC046900 TaxID=3155473 RepID=UPI0033C0A910
MRYWRHGIWVAAVLVTGVVFLVADRNGDLGKTEPLTAVLGFGLSMTGLAMSLLREGTTEDGRRSPQERIDRLTGQLAAVVQEQWQAEWRLRRLQDPAPLQVGWASADPWLSDHRENIGGPEDLSARLEQITEAFAQVPSRRLVVLGEPGSGKTVLAVRFTLDLLEHRQPQDAVPVLFPLSNWLPDHQSLQEWMTASLTATYPGATWGRELLTAGRILPVLDGLDEIPAPMQAHAIQRLNAELDADAPVLLTCRTQEYADVVEHGDVFTAAAVVELQPLPIEDVSACLRRTARPTRGANGQRTTRWDPVLDWLRSHPDEPAARALRQVLTSPLMVAMARAAYDDTEEDPAELLAPLPRRGRPGTAPPGRLRTRRIPRRPFRQRRARPALARLPRPPLATPADTRPRLVAPAPATTVAAAPTRADPPPGRRDSSRIRGDSRRLRSRGSSGRGDGSLRCR